MSRFIRVVVAAAVGVMLGCNASNSATGVAKQFYESLNSSNPAWACEHFQPCGSMAFYASDMDKVSNTVVGRISDVRVDQRTVEQSTTADVSASLDSNGAKAGGSSASEFTAEVTVSLKLDGAEKSGVVRMIKHNDVWKVRDGSGFRLLGIDFMGM
jgi:hypothetical protein